MPKMTQTYPGIHRSMYRNRILLLQSRQVGCVYCCSFYPPAKITKWVDIGQTALCPLCFMDAVVPDSVPFDEPGFLLGQSKLIFNVSAGTRKLIREMVTPKRALTPHFTTLSLLRVWPV